MSSATTAKAPSSVQRLRLREAEMAESLGWGLRTLIRARQELGLPHYRVKLTGSRRRLIQYDPAEVLDWISAHSEHVGPYEEHRGSIAPAPTPHRTGRPRRTPA